MAVYSYLFDETKSPSMPVMDVKLIEPGSGVFVGPLSALVDTGADGTLVPKHLLEDIGAIRLGSVVCAGYGTNPVTSRFI